MVLNMDGGVNWTIYGNTIEDDVPQDVDMKVTIGSSRIPKSRLEIFAGGERYVEMSLAHDGEFGFTAVLSWSWKMYSLQNMQTCSTIMRKQMYLNLCALPR